MPRALGQRLYTHARLITAEMAIYTAIGNDELNLRIRNSAMMGAGPRP